MLPKRLARFWFRWWFLQIHSVAFLLWKILTLFIQFYKTFYLVLLTTLDRGGKSVTFCWIPSHVGIVGNERADECAKRASLRQCRRFLPLPAMDFLAVCSSHIRLKWQASWESDGSSKLKDIKPRLAAWPSSLRTSRREEVALCRLRIGHTLATHRYLLCGDDRPRCSRCGEDLTVAHVLISCRLRPYLKDVRCMQLRSGSEEIYLKKSHLERQWTTFRLTKSTFDHVLKMSPEFPTSRKIFDEPAASSSTYIRGPRISCPQQQVRE